MDYAGKTVWITGASSGIGRALARSFAEEGARTLLSARREDRLEEVRAGLPQPERHRVLPLDLADTAAAPQTARRALDEMGHLDIVVHNAGLSQRALARDTGLEVDRRIFEVNFFGVVALTKALLPAMIEGGGGRFVVVSSLVGRLGTPLRSAYAASKHALHGFFDSLRAELWADGVRVTLVCPGFVRTDISRNALTGDGSPQGTLDRAQAEGMAPEICAAKILTAVARGSNEVHIGGRERWAVLLFRLFPDLFHRFIRNARVT